ncbi:hypothetical protein QLG25_22110 [Pseudomonas sp. CBR-F]
MPSLGEAPSGGAKRFLVTFLGACKKVTRCKSETISSRYRSNGYVHKTKNPKQKKATEVAQNALRAHVSEKT